MTLITDFYNHRLIKMKKTESELANIIKNSAITKMTESNLDEITELLNKTK